MGRSKLPIPEPPRVPPEARVKLKAKEAEDAKKRAVKCRPSHSPSSYVFTVDPPTEPAAGSGNVRPTSRQAQVPAVTTPPPQASFCSIPPPATPCRQARQTREATKGQAAAMAPTSRTAVVHKQGTSGFLHKGHTAVTRHFPIGSAVMPLLCLPDRQPAHIPDLDHPIV